MEYIIIITEHDLLFVLMYVLNQIFLIQIISNENSNMKYFRSLYMCVLKRKQKMFSNEIKCLIFKKKKKLLQIII